MKTTLLLLLCIFASNVFAQQKKTLSHLQDLASRIDTFLRNDQELPDTACLQRLILAKFTWTGSGVPKEVFFNPNTPKPFIQSITKAINATFNSSNISPALRKKIKNRTILYPLIVQQHSPCDYEYPWIDRKADSIVYSPKARWQRMYGPQLNESIANMLHFGNQEYSSLDCIILYPSVKGNMQ